MKKIISVALVMALMLTMSACGNKAFTKSNEAYDNVTTAYNIVDQMGSDLYEAWRLGIYDDDEILSNGVKHLAGELKLSEDELMDGIIYTMTTFSSDKDYESLTEEEKDGMKDTLGKNGKTFFSIFEDDLFQACVWIVTGAYAANGKTAEAQAALDSAKGQMKDLSEKHSDYEHYPSLKGYYTTTSSFFDFCQNPSGSFEQVKNTINDYRNEARDYKSDLDYIFED